MDEIFHGGDVDHVRVLKFFIDSSQCRRNWSTAATGGSHLKVWEWRSIKTAADQSDGLFPNRGRQAHCKLFNFTLGRLSLAT